MNKAQLQEQLNEVQVQAVSLIHFIDGETKLFQAAAFLQDGQSAQVHRDRLHALLDRQLDATASVMEITRRMITAKD